MSAVHPKVQCSVVNRFVHTVIQYGQFGWKHWFPGSFPDTDTWGEDLEVGMRLICRSM